MGVGLLEIGVKMRKGVIFTVRGCFRSVCNHPFLVGMLCFLIFLYRSSPLIFHLLVSTSPVLVCTAILLGTLLSFGQPNIPEIETEEKKTTVEAVSIKTGVSGDTTVVEENENHYVERLRWDGAKKSSEQSELLSCKLGEVHREEDSDDTAPLIEESEASNGENQGANTELGDLRFKEKTVWIEERLDNHHSSDAKVHGELVESDDEKSEADSFDSEKVNVDSLDSPPPSPWARGEERENEDEEAELENEDEDASDFGSDHAESSSPDASMADIMPMLDELHPLLEEEGPQTVHLCHESSDAASEKSSKSSAGSHHSDNESENHDDLEAADDENEEPQGDKDEETKSAITWTKEDQKNLMDLGSSEIERNLRLENLIMRRRARKNMSFLAERNLINFESSDLHFNLAPISTRRQNPFEPPQDCYDNSGLPPIPGSAPSVLLPRRNPFDIPYDSSEEKPDLKGDGFQEEFTSQSREPVFRRHESFNVRPSIFAPKRSYFGPERTISEESSSSLFQRQSSELSDSKVSSVLETESITSVEDLEEKKPPEKDRLPEREVTEGPSGDPELIFQREIETVEDVHQEAEMVSKVENVSEHIGHGRKSLEEDSLELGQVGKRDVQVGEPELEDVRDQYGQGSTTQYVELQGFAHGSDLVEPGYTRVSSSSSLSEVSERVFIDTEGEGLSMLEDRRDHDDEEPTISTQISSGSTVLDMTSTLVTNISQRAPVYESIDIVDKHDNVNTDLSGADHRSTIEGSSAAGSFAPHMFIPLRSSGEALMEEHLMEKHILDEVSVSSADKNIHTEVRSSEDQDLEQAEEKHLLLSGEHSLIEASETQFDGLPPRAEHLNAVDESAQSPNSDAVIQLGIDEKKLTSMLSAEGKTSHLYDNSIQEPDLSYLNEVQASSTPVKPLLDGQVTWDLNMPEVQELDRFINSPPSPNLVSFQQSAFQTNSSTVDVQTVVREADEIKEIDNELLSELDNVGDFSVRQLASGTKFENHVNCVDEENWSSTHQAEDSTKRVVEVNKIEHLLMESKEDIVNEHDLNFISEIPTYQTSRAENIEVSRQEFKELDNDFPYQDTFGDEILPKENEILPHSFVNRNHEVTISEMAKMEVESIEDVDVVTKKVEWASVENEVMLGVAEVSYQGQVDKGTTTEMPEVEASSIEDIDLAFKQISSKEREKHFVLPELQNHEDTVPKVAESEVLPIDDSDVVHKKPESTSESDVLPIDDTAVVLKKPEPTSVETEFVLGVSDVSCQGQVDVDTTSSMAELEASTVKDIDLAYEEISSEAIDNTDSGISELEVQLEEDVHAVPEHTEFTSVENELIMEDVDAYNQGQVNAHSTSEITEIEASTVEEINLALEQIIPEMIEKPVGSESFDADTTSGIPEIEASSVEAINMAFKHVSSEEIKSGDVMEELVTSNTTSGMPEIEASSVEAINLAYKHIGSEETKNCDVLEPVRPELVVGETITECLEDAAPDWDPVVPVSSNEPSILEVGPSKDDILNDKQMDDSIRGIDELHDSVDIAKDSEDSVPDRDRSMMASTNVTQIVEVGSIKDATFDGEQLTENFTGIHELHDSVDHTLHGVECGETQGVSSELHVGGVIVSEGNGTTLPPNQVMDGETDEQLALESDEEPSTTESSAFDAEKPNHKDEASEDLHSPSSVNGKGIVSTSSSSSSSSSSSTSSDSDR